MKQRSSEWFEIRHGRFTASEIHKLMGVKGLGETGKTYAFEKAIEQLYGQIDEAFESYDMARGTEMEPLAFEKVKQLKSMEFTQVDNCVFFALGNDAGASPDGLIGSDGILEIKCPKSKAFFKAVSDNEYDTNYFFQIQFQLLCTNRQKGYLFFYLIHEGNEYYHEIEIDRDDVIIDRMKDRLNEAIELKNNYIKKIQSNSQWIKEKEVI